MLYANTSETALNEELFQLVSKKIVGLRLSPVAFFAIRLLVVAACCDAAKILSAWLVIIVLLV